jgi:hypothetical protein
VTWFRNYCVAAVPASAATNRYSFSRRSALREAPDSDLKIVEPFFDPTQSVAFRARYGTLPTKTSIAKGSPKGNQMSREEPKTIVAHRATMMSRMTSRIGGRR